MTTAPTSSPAAPTQSADQRAARRLAKPPQRSGRAITWLLLLLTLALALPTLLVRLNRPDVIDPLEARALATSFQTQRSLGQQPAGGTPGFAVEHLVPQRAGQPLYRKPPGVTWAHLCSLGVARSLGAPWTVGHRVLYVRLSSVGAALLAIAAVFWVGHSMGGNPTAFLAALLLAANPVFLYHGRIAAKPIHLAAWSLLSIAAALWAIRPFKAPPSVERQFIGWTTSGLALGMTILVHGPSALLIVVAPILALLLLHPNRVSHLMGLLAATLIGVLMVMPWAFFVQEHDPLAWGEWAMSLLGAERSTATSQIGPILARVGLWTLLILAASLPWTFWLVGAAVQPFSTSSVGARVRLSMGWAWLAPLAMLLALKPVDDWRTQLLPVLPIVAVLIAALFRQIQDLAAQGRYVRFWRVLRWPHLVLISLISLALPVLPVLQPTLVANHWIRAPLIVTPQPAWLYALGLLGVLAGLMFLSWRWALQQFPTKALLVWSAWVLLVMPLVVIGLGGSPLMRSPVRGDAAVLTEEVAGHHLYWLVSDPGRPEPDPALMIYADLDAPPITPAQVPQLTQDQGIVYLLTDDQPHEPAANLTRRATLPNAKMKLWALRSDDRSKHPLMTDPMTSSTPNPDLSIVIPALNEEDNVAELVKQIRLTVIDAGIDAELIIVDDGSRDQTPGKLAALAAEHSWLRPLRRPEPRGQSAAMHAGIQAARGRLIATLDADLQNDPADLPRMMKLLTDHHADLVQGDRSRNRRDHLIRRVSSRVGRATRRLLLGDTVRDTGCSARVMTAAVARQLPLQFRGMHRFIPAYSRMLGAKIIETPVTHRPRTAGQTKYGLGVFSRAFAGLADCFAVRWMTRRYRDASVTPIRAVPPASSNTP